VSWISEFVRTRPKSPGYAEKTLAGYRLGIKAGGSIQGVRILIGDDSCPQCRMHAERIFTPDDAPKLPLSECSHPKGCRCAYTLAMKSRGETVDWSHARHDRG